MSVSKSHDGQWIVRDAPQSNGSFFQYLNGTWDPVESTWSFPLAEFGSCEDLLGMLGSLVTGEDSKQRDTAIKLLIYNHMVAKWDRTMTRTPLCEKHHVDISLGRVSLLEWVGCVTTPSEEATTAYMLASDNSDISGAMRTHYGLCYTGGTA